MERSTAFPRQGVCRPGSLQSGSCTACLIDRQEVIADKACNLYELFRGRLEAGAAEEGGPVALALRIGAKRVLEDGMVRVKACASMVKRVGHCFLKEGPLECFCSCQLVRVEEVLATTYVWKQEIGKTKGIALHERQIPSSWRYGAIHFRKRSIKSSAASCTS